MFEVIDKSPKRVDIVVNGQIDADEMRNGLNALIAASKDVSAGVMLYRITDFAMPSFGALGVEMGQLPKLFGLLGKFEKCAVVSDTGWIKKAAEIEGALIPGLKIKSFDLDAQDAAEAWLDEEQ
ncbi:STAS/SEC14 domain-containing protein [Yoonia sp.]|uniref:STAS/SEC14 domain-containing protein n=1 Tax=Yoonia sp. TaxID=2212373 RepID=UPI0023B3FE29